MTRRGAWRGPAAVLATLAVIVCTAFALVLGWRAGVDRAPRGGGDNPAYAVVLLLSGAAGSLVAVAEVWVVGALLTGAVLLARRAGRE